LERLDTTANGVEATFRLVGLLVIIAIIAAAIMAVFVVVDTIKENEIEKYSNQQRCGRRTFSTTPLRHCGSLSTSSSHSHAYIN